MRKHALHLIKRILFLAFLFFVLWVVIREAKGVDLGIKKASEYVVIPLIEPLDSAGIPRKPDSVHIITYADNGSAKAFSTTNTTYPFDAVGIDTTKDYGDTAYWFVDQIQDIDGAGGNFELAIVVTLFCDKLPTTTRATVQVIDDSLNKKFGLIFGQALNIRDTVNAILDTLQLWDDDIALIGPVRDTVNSIQLHWDSLLAYKGGVYADSIPDSLLTERKIKHYTFSNAQLHGSWLTASKIANGAFLGTKFGANFLTKDKISTQAFGYDEMHESWRDSVKAWSDTVAIVDSVTKVARTIFVDSTDTIIKPPQSIAFVDSVDTLHSSVSAVSCAGWGAYTVTLYLLDDSDSTAVAGVKINIYDSTSGVWQAGHITPANGIRQFSLDASTYTIHLQDPPNSITSPEYMTISADTTDTFWVDVFDPGAPPSGDKCRVWCLISDLTSNWMESCRLSVWIPKRYHPVLLGATLVSPYTVSGISNDTGYVYVDVYESGELTAGSGATVKMYIEAKAPNGDLLGRTFVEIPDAVDYEIVW